MPATPDAALDPAAVRVLLCDADGTLFPSEEPAFDASAGVTTAFLGAMGVPARVDAEELRRATTGRNFRTTAVDLCLARGVPVHPALAARHPGAATSTAAAVAGRPVLTPEVLDRWVAEEQRRVTAHLGAVLRPDPAVREPLAGLARRFALAVVSSSALPRLDACFTATGLADLLPRAVRFSAEDSLPVPTSKPDPAVYRLAGERLGCSGADAVAVEDAVPGVLSAVGAGFPTVGHLAFVPPAERDARAAALREAGAFAVVGSWRELAALLLPSLHARA